MNWYEEVDLEVKKNGVEATSLKPSRACAELVGKWEGFRKHAYLDTLANPPVWTIGYGETLNVSEGDSTTQGRAKEHLKERLGNFWDEIEGTIEVSLVQPLCDALTSFSYNVGTSAFKSSTLLRKLNQGDYEGAADEFPRWNKSGGKVRRGLVRRRKSERGMFLRGVKEIKDA